MIKMVKLGNIAKLINGDRGKNYPSQADITENGEIPFVNAGHLNGRNIDFCEMNYISQDKYNKLSSGKFQKGDILYCLRGSLGKKAFVKNDINGAIASSLVIIRPNFDKVYGEYLMFALDSPTIKNQLVRANNGSSQPNLSAASVREYDVELPELSVQREIVDKLVRVRSIIDSRQKELELLDNLTKARFVEMFGDVKHGEKYKGIPLRELCITMSGGTPSTKNTEYYEGNIPWITTVSLGPNHIDGSTAKGYITQDAIKNSATKLIPAGNILFGTRVGVGKSSINDVDICTNQDIIAIIGIDENRFNRVFIKHVLDDYQPYYDSLKKGATILGITSDDLKDTLIPDAPIDVQTEFVAFVDQVDKSKVAIQKALDETKLLFDSLMQKYFG